MIFSVRHDACHRVKKPLTDRSRSIVVVARPPPPPPAEGGGPRPPPAGPATASIPGIDVMDLEDAAKALWKAGIYAETGMGCTGPLVMMSDANHAKAVELLKAAGYIG